MSYKREKVLITTKTYPSISKTYKETVCTAGILLDENNNPKDWIRLYPISFRYMDYDQQYRRYSIIEVDVQKNDKDQRRESYRVKEDTISEVEQIDTKKEWARRKRLIFPLVKKSLEEMKDSGDSLGMIKPKRIIRYFEQDTDREWDEAKQAVLNQKSLLVEKKDLEKIPYQFGYEFECDDERCSGHKMTILDWEICQLFRNCRDGANGKTPEQKEKEALEKVKARYEQDFLQNKDLYLMLGNQQLYPSTFMIIGVFSPPKTQQLDLFLNNS